MYNTEIYCTRPYCIENPYWTRCLRRLVQYGISIQYRLITLYNKLLLSQFNTINMQGSILVLRSVFLTPIDFTSFFAKNGTYFHSHRIRSFSHFHALRHYLVNPFPVNKTHKLQQTILKQ